MPGTVSAYLKCVSIVFIDKDTENPARNCPRRRCPTPLGSTRRMGTGLPRVRGKIATPVLWNLTSLAYRRGTRRTLGYRTSRDPNPNGVLQSLL